MKHKSKKILAYPTSYAQKRIWFLEKLEKGRLHNNIGGMSRFFGIFRIDDIRLIVQSIFNRHEICRTNFQETAAGELIQIVHTEREAELKTIDLRHLSTREKEIARAKIVDEETKHIFNLESEQLIRFIFIRLTEEENIFLVVGHHIISDAWSMSIAANEFFYMAQALFYKKNFDLPALSIQYKDYATWEQGEEFANKILTQEKYWQGELAGDLPILDIPLDFKRPLRQVYETQIETIEIDLELKAQISDLCQKFGVTSYVFLLTIFEIFLYKLSRQSDILIGTFVANRDLPELDNVIGIFLNNLVIRTRLDSDKTFSSLLSETKEKVLLAMENKEFPFEKLLEKLNPARDLGRSPIFNVVFQMFNTGGHNDLNKNIFFDLIKEYITFDKTLGQFDLTVHVHDRKDDFLLVFAYNPKLFKTQTIKRYLNYFKQILINLNSNPRQTIGKIEMIPEKERLILLEKFNNTDYEYEKEKNLYDIFLASVKKYPERIAVSQGTTFLTYTELLRRVNNFSNFFAVNNIKTSDVIGVSLERSIEYLCTILALTRIGAIFVPLDLDNPIERIKFIINDAKIKHIVVSDNEKLFDDTVSLINISNVANDKSSLKELDDACTEKIAAIIYTSGSSGRPKGVPLSHQGIINHAMGKIKFLDLKSTDIIAQNLSNSFVASLWQFFSPIFIGAKIVIYPTELCQDLPKLFSSLANDKITIWETSPTGLKIFLSLLPPEEDFAKDLKIILTGEDTPGSLVKNYFSSYSFPLINAYGQTECSDDTMMYLIPPACGAKVLLGYPMINTKAYILSPDLELLPFGVVGEIYISGAGVSEGYLNNPEQTREVFLSHPFIEGQKIYRTGDLGRRLESGEIEYLGRIDGQIKIRGKRIELKEIENTFLGIKGVHNCLVLNKNDQIVVYYMSADKFPAQYLRQCLLKFLPVFMLPTFFVYLKSFPLNSHGKLDKKALPMPTRNDMVKLDYESCESDEEKLIHEIWKNVLSLGRISRTEDFFELGGHSLSAAQVVNKLRENGYSVSLRDIFKYSRLNDLAKKILEKKSSEIIEGGVPMTIIGNRMRINDSNIINSVYIFEEIRVLDIDVYQKSITSIKSKYNELEIKIKNENLSIEKFLENKKELLKSVKDFDVFFYLVRDGNKNYLFVTYNKATVDAAKFSNILLTWQKLYNLELARVDNDKTYTPFCSYPDYYHCLHANLLEKLCYKNNKILKSSLAPAFDYFLLPNYFIVDENTRRDNDFNACLLGGDNLFVSAEKFGLKSKLLKFENAVSAREYFDSDSQSEPLLLMGNNYYLPSSPYYKNPEFIGSLLEGRNLLPMNFSIFQSWQNKIIVSSVNLNYFGQISEKDFYNYWQNFKDFDIAPQKNLKKIDLSFQALVLSEFGKTNTIDIDMFYEALNANVEEFFKGQIIKGGKNQGFKKAIFGIKVLPCFIDDILRGTKDDRRTIPDIVIVDMFKRLQKPRLFLHDLLQDICALNDDFLAVTEKLANIIKIGDNEFESLNKKVKNSTIKYDPILTFLPSQNAKKVKFLTAKDKRELIKTLEEIQDQQFELFESMKKILEKL